MSAPSQQSNQDDNDEVSIEVVDDDGNSGENTTYDRQNSIENLNDPANTTDDSIVVVDDEPPSTENRSQNQPPVNSNPLTDPQPILVLQSSTCENPVQPIIFVNISDEITDHQSISKAQKAICSRFWLRILELQPDFSGRVVYFTPSLKSLRCIINADGTISPVCSLANRFNSAVRLVDVLKSGRLKTPPDFKMGKQISSTFYSFSQDFFLQPGRRETKVKDFFPPKVAKELFALEKEQEKTHDFRILDSFNLDEPLPVTMAVPRLAEKTSPAGKTARPGTSAADESSSGIDGNTSAGASDVPVVTSSGLGGKTSAGTSAADETEEDATADGFELSEFWNVAIKVKPELVGKTVYFVPTFKKVVACVVNDDGTFSPQCDPMRKYKEAADMVVDIVWQRLNLGPDGFTALHKSPISFTCVTDFFMDRKKETSVLQYLGKFGRCPGSERAKFEPLIKDRQWDGARKEFSPIITEGKIIRSKLCTGVVSGEQKKCPNCKKSHGVLRRLLDRLLKNPQSSNTERRIKFSGASFLTPEEQKKKSLLLKRDWQKKIVALQSQISKLEKQKLELQKYKPIHEINQAAVRSLVEHLNEETTKVTSPTCYWMGNEEEICGFTATSLADMCAHVNSVHHRGQVLANEGVSEEDRKFYCRWKGCNRRQPFLTGHKLHLHLFDHTGSRATVQQLLATRCQLKNLGCPPTARRYNDAIRQSIIQNDGQGGDMSLVSSCLPIPSQRTRQTILKRKEKVDRSAEIDGVVESVFQKMTGAVAVEYGAYGDGVAQNSHVTGGDGGTAQNGAGDGRVTEMDEDEQDDEIEMEEDEDEDVDRDVEEEEDFEEDDDYF